MKVKLHYYYFIRFLFQGLQDCTHEVILICIHNSILSNWHSPHSHCACPIHSHNPINVFIFWLPRIFQSCMEYSPFCRTGQWQSTVVTFTNAFHIFFISSPFLICINGKYCHCADSSKMTSGGRNIPEARR